MDSNKSNAISVTAGIILVVFSIVGLIALMMWGLPKYRVYSSEQSGKAKLAEARFSKQTQLEQAKANLESERLNAQSEVERAKGAAEAIRIEGGNLSDNYIKYLWVRNLENSKGSKIYIPTEAGIPILEAK